MKVIRQVGNVQLNEGQLMANGLYNLFNTETKEVSLWFDDEIKDDLMKLSDDEFIEEAIIKFEIADLQP